MPKPSKFKYEKKSPYRDAFYFIVVCEGQNREVDYFRFFDKLSSRVKVVSVSAKDNSAPKHLVEIAHNMKEELGADSGNDQLWFVLDTDQWGKQLHDIRSESQLQLNWNVAQSNPCFEVWLYFHVKSSIPELEHLMHCNQWKPFLHSIIKGGFNNDFHPVYIETAVNNAKENYQANGYLPELGSTQLWKLGETLLPLIKKELDALKDRLPKPVIKD